jgi:glyoxylase-like metal-dependent hydrolase (beta-lactamase superfamily II)
LIIDPTFDVKIYQDLITKRKSKLKAVVLTHYHADYLAGHTQFNAPIYMGKHAKRAVNAFEVH